ncbi:MAG: hypothetical protein K6G60_09560 [Lachnospiraceae bacterium]|nr:hypothetical protein [Lachnospiraceae bacterium]
MIDLSDVVCMGLTIGSHSTKLFILMIFEILLLIGIWAGGLTFCYGIVVHSGADWLWFFAPVLIITAAIWYISVKTKFIVEYAGGRIIVDASANSLSELRSFHSKIRLAKDKRVYGEKAEFVVYEQ